MRLSQRVQAIQPSPTLAITAKAKALAAAGVKVMPLAAGEPDFPTPEPIRLACVRALEAGHTGYTPSAGIPELRVAIRRSAAERFRCEWGDDQVVVCCGAKQALYNAIQSLLEPGGQAVIQAPYWVSYPDQVVLAGGQSVILPPVAGFSLNREALRAAVTPATRAIVLNSPSNPSGALLSEDDLDTVADVARSHDLVVISDDIYDQLVYGGRRAPHLLDRHPEFIDRTLVVNGVSKAYSMTGWRLGWALGPKALIGAMRKLQDQSTSNATTFVQHAAITALGSPPEMVAGMRDEFDRRRRLIVTRLSAIEGVRCDLPDGAFYAFANFEPVLQRRLAGTRVGTSLRLAELLLEHEQVAAVPGEAFGVPGHIRFSFACGPEVIEQAMDRVARFLARLE